MKGNDNRTVPNHALSSFASMIHKDPLGHSFLVYNPNEAVNKLRNWNNTLPWITPHYAIKSNPIKPLLHDIASLDGSFDCASKGEIKIVLAHGVSPSKIIYSNPVKTEKDLSWATKNGVLLTTADTMDEIIKIKTFAPNMKILWRISIIEDNPELLCTKFSGKFGDDIVSLEDAETRFKQIRAMGVQLEGIHFHCGSAQQGSPSFGKAIDLAKACMDVGRVHGHRMQLLDIGGGFPSGDLSHKLVQTLKKTQDDPLGYKVIAEPGRHFSANTCHLAFRILTRRVKQGKLCYHVNESLYHSFNCILMDGVSYEQQTDQFYQKCNKKGEISQIGNQDWSSLFGMTCDGRDVIADHLKMPDDMQVGDWLIMGGMGAYTYGPRSKFNGMKSTTTTRVWNGEMVEKQEEQIQPSLAGLAKLNY